MAADAGWLATAFIAFASGDRSALLGRLDPDVEWRQGSRSEIGRDAVVRRLAGAKGGAVEILGIRNGVQSLTFELARPWWKRSRRTSAFLRTLVGLRYEQVVSVRAGRIVRVEVRQRLALS